MNCKWDLYHVGTFRWSAGVKFIVHRETLYSASSSHNIKLWLFNNTFACSLKLIFTHARLLHAIAVSFQPTETHGKVPVPVAWQHTMWLQIKQLRIDVPAGTIHQTCQLLVWDDHSAAESVLPSSACAAIYGVMPHVHISNTPSSTNVIVELSTDYCNKAVSLPSSHMTASNAFVRPRFIDSVRSVVKQQFPRSPAARVPASYWLLCYIIG